MFDAIVVGARCGGAPTAMLLARKGFKVLLVDRAAFPSDTLSTHFLWPRAVSYLNRWGVLPSLRRKTPTFSQMRIHQEDVTLVGRVPLDHLKARFKAVHGDDGAYVTEEYCSIRRTLLDDTLVRAAVEAGVEVRTDFAVEEFLYDGERVTGIAGSGREGGRVIERARVVIGADGRRSLLAKTVDAPTFEPHPKCSFAYFSYFSGVKLEPRMMRRGRLGAAIVPTNDQLSMVLTFGPADWFESFLADPERNFHLALRAIDEETAARVAEGRREEKFKGTNDMSAYWRNGAGNGWLLVGDAACFKDQTSAAGIMHAFRDGDLAAECLSKGLSGAVSIEAAADEYSKRRYHDGIDFYRFACGQGEMNPARLDELELFDAVAASQAQTDRFISTFGDTYPVRKLMSKSSLSELFKGRPAFDEARRAAHERRLDAQAQNPFLADKRSASMQVMLSRTALDFARGQGTDLVARTEGYADWVKRRREDGTWSYTKFIAAAPNPTVEHRDEKGRINQGVNFGSQDYLSLCTHPAVRDAAAGALREFGPHSAGSAMGMGNTLLSQRLEQVIAEHFQMNHTLLFPTGWAAGFGAIAGLVGTEDHVVLDSLAHNCLLMGARAATSRLHRNLHGDLESIRHILAKIRETDPRNGILVVTEGLFSMHSDSPRIEALQNLCHEYQATLLVDVAHDAGALGPQGTGQLGIQNMLGKVDLVMGSFSKTFASNGGFLVAKSEGVTQYVKHFAGPHIYSNGLSPMQAAVVLKSFEIVRGAEGNARRARLMSGIETLRAALAKGGVVADGRPSPIVPVVVGDERAARLAYREVWAKGVGVTMVEFPVVESGKARFRLQVMADHTAQQCEEGAEIVSQAVRSAYAALEQMVGGRAASWPVFPPVVREHRKSVASEAKVGPELRA